MFKVVVFIVFLLSCSVGLSDVYVMVNEATEEVVDISDRDDAVVQPGMKKVVLPGMILKDMGLLYSPTEYKIKGNKLVANTQKISDNEVKKEQHAELVAEKLLIQKELQNIAIKALKEKGVAFKHLKEE